MKVLVSEGRRGPTDDVSRRLRELGHDVVRGATAETARSLIHAHEPRLIVLIALPVQTWQVDLLNDLQLWEQTPFSLAITSTEATAAVTLLRAGADAFCTYPPPGDLFEAEVEALSRRALALPVESPVPEVVTVRDLSVDNSRYQATFAGERMPLTPAEFRILASLARRPGKVVRNETLAAEALGGAGGRPSRDILKVHVRRIRNKIVEAGGSADYIWNIRGVGYMLERRASGGRDRGSWDEGEPETDPPEAVLG